MSEKKEYIERGAAQSKARAVRTCCNNQGEFEYTEAVLINDLNSIPAADVEPVVWGEWIKYKNILKDSRYTCSNCRFRYAYEYRHCPNCGAHMERSGSGERE